MKYAYVGCRTTKARNARGEGLKTYEIRPDGSWKELLPDVRLRLPVIVMDGAALYDIGKREYLKTVRIPEADALRMKELLDRSGLSYFTNTIEDHLLVVHCGELGNGAIRQLYEDKKRSAYRNFVTKQEEHLSEILYFMVLDEEARVRQLHDQISRQEWSGAYHLVYDGWKQYPGSACLKIYAAAANRETMLRELEASLGLSKTVVFGTIPGRCDVLTDPADRDAMVRKLKQYFEPVSLRGWRNVLRVGDLRRKGA